MTTRYDAIIIGAGIIGGAIGGAVARAIYIPESADISDPRLACHNLQRVCDIGFFSRLRELNTESSFSVIG